MAGLALCAVPAGAQRISRVPQAPPLDTAPVPQPRPVSGQRAALSGTVADSLGAPVPDAKIAADGVDQIVSSDRDGRFLLGNLPVGDHVVRVSRAGFEPLMFKVALPAPATVSLKLTLFRVTALSLEDSARLARGGVRSSIVGLVTDQYDVPIRLAQVTAMGTTVSTLTDSLGRFRIDALPFGPYFLRVRKVGFGPQVLTVQLKTTDSADLHIRLDSRANVLATTTVTADAERANSRLRGFYERKGKATGFFFEAEEIARRRPPQLTDLFRAVPSLTVERDGSGRQVVLGRLIGTRRCAMALIVDGTFIKDGNALGALDGIAPPDQVRAVEVYTSNINVPAEFARPGTECGAVVVWTK
jgi:hypothetical protein